MPQIDMEPGDYRRKKGWRWRLKLGDPNDNRLPLILCILSVVMAGVFIVRAGEAPIQAAFAAAVFGFSVGTTFMLWTRR